MRFHRFIPLAFVGLSLSSAFIQAMPVSIHRWGDTYNKARCSQAVDKLENSVYTLDYKVYDMPHAIDVGLVFGNDDVAKYKLHFELPPARDYRVLLLRPRKESKDLLVSRRRLLRKGDKKIVGNIAPQDHISGMLETDPNWIEYQLASREEVYQ
ncbi:hypothetical protein EV360DRAFT_69895 [Lentinula raphanica]|nr:hypothetical protein EV360DRAFT_69895 [Lentinula raphanica]